MDKSKSYLLTGLLLLAVIGGFILLSKPGGQVSQNTGGKKAVLNQTYNFGKVSMAAGKVNYVYSLKNTLGKEIKMEKIYTSCMCTEAILRHDNDTHGPFGMSGHGMAPNLDETIAPDEEFAIEAIFDPAAHGPAGVGKVERIVFLELEGSEQIQLKFTAEVTP